MKKKSCSPIKTLSLAIGAAIVLAAGALLYLGGGKEPVTTIEIGRHYDQVSESKVVDKDVVIFFWYGCPHCLKAYKAFEADGFFNTLESEGKTVRRVPVVANKTWELHARLYHALSLNRMSPQGHLYTMELIQKHSATNERSIEQILPRVIDNELQHNPKFKATVSGVMKALHSSRVDKLLIEDSSLVSAARIEGVPTLLVGGKDRIVISPAVGYGDLSVISLKLLSPSK